jgi:dinuclear metal center YbgI/SA1388 family protein
MGTVGEWLARLDELFPPSWAEDWDNTGLQVGDRTPEVSRIVVALDPTSAVIDEAADVGAQLLITHHPLIFEALSMVDVSRPIDRTVAQALRLNLAVIACHTNADVASPGVSDALAEALDITVEGPLVPHVSGTFREVGLGRIGELAASTQAADMLELCRDRLGAHPRLIGERDADVKRVAVCGGSGASLIPAAIRAGADMFITGDVKHHQALDARSSGLHVIDAGHYATERPFVPRLADRLRQLEPSADILVSETRTDPFKEG